MRSSQLTSDEAEADIHGHAQRRVVVRLHRTLDAVRPVDAQRHLLLAGGSSARLRVPAEWNGRARLAVLRVAVLGGGGGRAGARALPAPHLTTDAAQAAEPAADLGEEAKAQKDIFLSIAIFCD